MTDKTYLLKCGLCLDGDIDLINASFAFALHDNPNINIEKYAYHFESLLNDLKYEYGVQQYQNISSQYNALKTILAEKYAYVGDDMNYDDIRNSDIFHVMDRRMGLPITLSIIAIALCRKMGWVSNGLNFPGHFLMSLEKDGEKIILDPFQGCKILEAKDMRVILKKMIGGQAELSADYYLPCSNREILLRLRNNLKYRLIDMSEYQRAMGVVETMTWIAPDDYRLNLDKAVLYSRLEQPKSAIDNLLIYIDKVENKNDKFEAEQFLQQLQRQLN